MRLPFVLLLVVGVAPMIQGCMQPMAAVAPGGDHGKPAEAAMIRVAVIHPMQKTLIRRVEQPGEIRALEQTPLHAKVTGYISEVHVDLGDRVTAGKLLAEISIPEYEQELKQKQALVAQVKAETTQAKAAIKVAEAALRSAAALAKEAESAVERVTAEQARTASELERITELFQNKAVTQRLVDEALAANRAAIAAQAEAQARIISAQAIVAEKAAAVEQAEADAEAVASKQDVAAAEVARLEAVHQYTRITAPFEGVITDRHIDTGHFVQPGKSNGDKPLLVVARVDVVRVFVDVPEADAALVAPDCEANIRIPSTGSTLQGKVSRTAWKLDPTSRTLRTAIDIDNKDGNLRPGLYVIADLKVAERPNAMSLPRAAVITKDQQAFCLTVDEKSQIVRTPITLGIRSGDDVEVTSGLNGTEQVIPANVSAYREGMIVEVIAPAAR